MHLIGSPRRHNFIVGFIFADQQISDRDYGEPPISTWEVARKIYIQGFFSLVDYHPDRASVADALALRVDQVRCSDCLNGDNRVSSVF